LKDIFNSEIPAKNGHFLEGLLEIEFLSALSSVTFFWAIKRK